MSFSASSVARQLCSNQISSAKMSGGLLLSLLTPGVWSKVEQEEVKTEHNETIAQSQEGHVKTPMGKSISHSSLPLTHS